MVGTKSQLGYILIKKKWRNSIKNVEVYSSFYQREANETTSKKPSTRESEILLEFTTAYAKYS